MRALAALAAATLTVGAAVSLAAPASAHGQRPHQRPAQSAIAGDGTGLLASPNVEHLSASPGQVGISGCFMKSASIFVTSGADSVRVWDVTDAAHPTVVGVLPQALFENEAMNCGERTTKDGKTT